MVRILSVAAALAASATLLGATAGHAQSANYYTATPVAKPTKTSFVTRDTVWKWRDSAFVARQGSDRDSIMCSLVAQRAGKLSAFTVGGAALAADALEKCNAKAK